MKRSIMSCKKNSTVILVERESRVVDHICKLSCKMHIVAVDEPKKACIATVHTHNKAIL